VADQAGPQRLGMQPHVLRHPMRDGQPHRVGRQHQRPVRGERPADGAEQRMYPVRRKDWKLLVTTDDDRVRPHLTHRAGRQCLRRREDVVDHQGRHGGRVCHAEAADNRAALDPSNSGPWIAEIRMLPRFRWTQFEPGRLRA
jgi:hypothetical protein